MRGMATDIMIPVAALPSGEPAWADDPSLREDRRDDLRCLGCSERLVLRAGGRNRPHFAHHAGGDCTAPATALHRIACQVLASGLALASTSGGPWTVDFDCAEC
jgi:hypothetical protein